MPVSSKFYNTIGLSVAELREARAMVKGQEETILKLMESVHGALTPLEIEDALRTRGTAMLRSSVVRALRNLVMAGLLEKTGELVMERYGKKNHKWRLAEPKERGQLRLF